MKFACDQVLGGFQLRHLGHDGGGESVTVVDGQVHLSGSPVVDHCLRVPARLDVHVTEDARHGCDGRVVVVVVEQLPVGVEGLVGAVGGGSGRVVRLAVGGGQSRQAASDLQVRFAQSQYLSHHVQRGREGGHGPRRLRAAVPVRLAQLQEARRDVHADRVVGV